MEYKLAQIVNQNHIFVEHNQFSQRGYDVDLELTPSSIYQAEQTSAGNFDIICTAFDNVVAYGSGQGAAKIGTSPDYVAIMGATQLELSLIVAPEIKTVADLAGKTIALDAFQGRTCRMRLPVRDLKLYEHCILLTTH